MQLHQRIFTTCMLCISLLSCVLGAQSQVSQRQPFLTDIKASNGEIQTAGHCINPLCHHNKPQGFSLQGGYCVQMKQSAAVSQHHPEGFLNQTYCKTCKTEGKSTFEWWDDCCECGKRYITIDVANEADSFMKSREKLMCLIRACEYLRDSFNTLYLLGEKKKGEYEIKKTRMYQQLTIFASPFYTTDCNLIRDEEAERYRTDLYFKWKRRKVLCKWLGAALAISGGVMAMHAVGKSFVEAQLSEKNFSEVWFNFAKDLELVFGQSKRMVAKKRSNGNISMLKPHRNHKAAMKQNPENQTLEVDFLNYKTPSPDEQEPDIALLVFIENLKKFRRDVDITKKITDEQRDTIENFQIELSAIIGEGVDLPRSAEFQWTANKNDEKRDDFKANKNTIDPDYKLRFFKFSVPFRTREMATAHFLTNKRYFKEFVDYIGCRVIGDKLQGTVCLKEYQTVKHIYKYLLRLADVKGGNFYPKLELYTLRGDILEQELKDYTAKKARKEKEEDEVASMVFSETKYKMLNPDDGQLQRELHLLDGISKSKIAIKPVLEYSVSPENKKTAMEFLKQLWVPSIVELERRRVANTLESNTERIKELESMLHSHLMRINSVKKDVDVMKRNFPGGNQSPRSVDRAASLGSISDASSAAAADTPETEVNVERRRSRRSSRASSDSKGGKRHRRRAVKPAVKPAMQRLSTGQNSLSVVDENKEQF